MDFFTYKTWNLEKEVLRHKTVFSLNFSYRLQFNYHDLEHLQWFINFATIL
jgi:hypothetical protein